MTPARSGLLLSLVFFISAVACSAILPLWLDEILQLLETRDTSPKQMLSILPRNPGAAPLGYLVQQASLRIGGYSVRRARLPMALFAAGSVFLVTLLASELGVRWPWLAATLFAAFPLTFRYATESRVYSQALFFSVLATLIYVRAAKRPSSSLAVLYGLVLTAAIYTQPFAASVGIAHIVWSVTQQEKWAAWMGTAAVVSSVAVFLPWYFWSRNMWTAFQVLNGLHFSATAKTPLMLFRELAGAGYWGSGLLLILCTIAIANRLPESRVRLLLISLIAVPFLAILAADVVFDYFIAARQFIWVLPAVAILAASAAERYPRVGLTLAAVFCVVGIAQSVRYFTQPHEDFGLAASALANEAQQGSCVTITGLDQYRLYQFFEPRLARISCDGDRMVLALSPYVTMKERATAIDELTARGFQQEREAQAGGSSLVFLHR
jgi:4-amino-4-deoxy-L-arabinose transferase-like glycosyltransferase